MAEGGIRLPISKSNALGALFQLSRGNIVPGFHAFECAGIQTISLIDKRQTIVSLPLQELKMALFEFAMGLHSYNFSFSSIKDYPHIVSEYSNIGLNLNDEDIVYTGVYNASGIPRMHSPLFTTAGLICIRQNRIDIYGNLEEFKNLSVLTDDELLWKGKSFSTAIGNTRNFSGDKAKSFCSSDFILYRYNAMSEENPVSTSQHSLSDWVDMAIVVRNSHEAMYLREAHHEGEYYAQNFNKMDWRFRDDGKLWAKGLVAARYDGTSIGKPLIERADPLVASLLLDDDVHRDITYEFEYCFEFNSIGLITALHLYRDAEQMARCYQLNSSDIDAILLSASKMASQNNNSQVANQVIELSKLLYDAEQKELAITKLFKAVDMASFDNRNLAVDAMGSAIYKMMRDDD